MINKRSTTVDLLTKYVFIQMTELQEKNHQNIQWVNIEESVPPNVGLKHTVFDMCERLHTDRGPLSISSVKNQ